MALSKAGEIFCEELEQPTELEKLNQAVRNVNGTVVLIKAEKIGLKDAEVYIDPRLTCIVADPLVE